MEKTRRIFISKSGLALVGWLALCFGVAAIGAQFRPGEWYAGLKKPVWNPPPWIFAPVWTTLYAMMAVAAWLVWRGGGFLARRGPLGLFLVQLLLNALWSPLFFGLHQPALAFVDLLLLWLTLVGTVRAFFRIERLAGSLLVPYLAWASFAAALNFALWRLNV